GPGLTLEPHEAEEAVAHIVRADPAYERVVAAVGPYEPRPPRADYFNALAASIVYQQLAGRAARAIHERFNALYAELPTAEAVLRTPLEQLRAVGLSGSKSASIVDLAAKTSDGTVPRD